MLRKDNSTVGLFPLPKEVLKEEFFAKIIDTTKERANRLSKVIINYLQGNPLEKTEGVSFSRFCKKHALLILQNLDKELTITGTMHFPFFRRILIQYDGHDYILRYGDLADDGESYYYFKPMTAMEFDHENGFINKGEYTVIKRELQIKFMEWKARGSLGRMITPESADFQDKDIKDLKDCCSMEELHSKLIYKAWRTNDLHEEKDLFAFLENEYDKLNIANASKLNIFEHCVLFAAGCLPLPLELNQCRFITSENKSQILFKLPVVFIYLGSNDDTHCADDSDFRKELDKVYDNCFINIQKKYGHMVQKIHNGNLGAGRLLTTQKSLVMPINAAFEILITNPLLTASFLLKHHEEIKDKSFIRKACAQLKKDIRCFLDLPEGVPNEHLHKMIRKLNKLKSTCSMEKMQSPARHASSTFHHAEPKQQPVNTINTKKRVKRCAIQ